VGICSQRPIIIPCAAGESTSLGSDTAACCSNLASNRIRAARASRQRSALVALDFSLTSDGSVFIASASLIRSHRCPTLRLGYCKSDIALVVILSVKIAAHHHPLTCRNKIGRRNASAKKYFPQPATASKPVPLDKRFNRDIGKSRSQEL